MKEMIMSLIIILGAFAYIQINKRLEVKRAEQQEKARKMRELRSQMKLQVKRDEFEEFKKSADGNSMINNKCLREGFVYRSQDGQKSFKNVSRKFLLKEED